MANTKQCKECGCQCSKCASSDHDVHLHVEIENLKQRLVERDSHILNMETNFLIEANKYPNGELGAVQEELLTWQDKYKRLYEAHKRVQRVNQGLEDKLLKLVDTCETDKSTLTKDVATLSHKLAEANYTIKKLMEDNERYKNDVSLAIQFLQCKPGNFISQKVDSLPNEVQAKVSSYLQGKRKPEEKKPLPDVKSIKVPIPTFPPTAMVYSVPKSPNPVKKGMQEMESQPVDIVSAAIMAKVLEERERERANLKHCDTCSCSRNMKIIHYTTHHTVSTQTGTFTESSCLKCNRLMEIGNVQIVKNPEQIKNKIIPMYIQDNNTNQNIAKVQPNNFLMDKCITGDIHKHCIVLPASSSGLGSKRIRNDLFNPNQHSAKCEELDRTVIHFNINETSKTSNILKKEDIVQNIHYELCDMSSKAYEVESNNISDQSSIINASNHSEQLKGPRYCSMRLQTGSKNILLDNTHNNIPPVLYTRHQDRKFRNEKTETSIISSGEIQSSVADVSFQHQRVAEWVESNNQNAADTSKSEHWKNEGYQINKAKYAEMEKNVKRFLFGENDFMKTVELGKQKYLDYQEDFKGDEVEKSQTETDI